MPPAPSNGVKPRACRTALTFVSQQDPPTPTPTPPREGARGPGAGPRLRPPAVPALLALLARHGVGHRVVHAAGQVRRLQQLVSAACALAGALMVWAAPWCAVVACLCAAPLLLLLSSSTCRALYGLLARTHAFLPLQGAGAGKARRVGH